MLSTSTREPAPYLGADLTDRTARSCRPIDVCGLEPAPDGRLRARFWQWLWDPAPEPVQLGPVLAEVRGARCAMLDGPQALASAGRTLRACERRSRAAAKTPDRPPEPGRPYAGFVRSSLDLFAGLDRSGVPIGAVPGPTACETYPAEVWLRLAGERLPRKTTREGVAARVRLLELHGVVGLPPAPSHDHCDAAACALVAAAWDGAVEGLVAEAVGDELTRDADGTLREGVMILPAR